MAFKDILDRVRVIHTSSQRLDVCVVVYPDNKGFAHDYAYKLSMKSLMFLSLHT